jgi:putative endonuclease
MGFFVYLLECRDKSLYCGYTIDVKARVAAHNKGKAAKYTRPRRPVKLVYLEEKKTKGEALKREAEIKSFSRSQKLELVKSRENN